MVVCTARCLLSKGMREVELGCAAAAVSKLFQSTKWGGMTSVH